MSTIYLHTLAIQVTYSADLYILHPLVFTFLDFDCLYAHFLSRYFEDQLLTPIDVRDEFYFQNQVPLFAYFGDSDWFTT